MNIKENAFEIISKIQSNLNVNQITSSLIIEKDYNYEISTTINRQKFKVQVYFGKKGVKTIVQGNQESSEFQQLQNFIQDQPVFNFADSKTEIWNEYIGSDECGKGDYFGPLVVAAVYVDSNLQRELKSIGVRDSKDLSECQIHDLAKHIRLGGHENIEVVKINPVKYNQLYNQFKNLNKLLNWAHSKAIDNLLQKTNCKTVITDKFSNRDLTITSNKNYAFVEFIQEHRAEKYVGVAAASIIARDEFNNWFADRKRLGYDLPKGSSEIVTKAALSLVKKIKGDKLSEFVKLHFKTTGKIL